MKKICILLLSCYCSILYGQKLQSVNSTAQRAYEKASQLIAIKDYDKAVLQLGLAVKADPSFLAAWQQLGDVYRKTQDYISAKESYKKILIINPEFTPLTYFGLAESEFNTGDYENALNHFRKYNSYPNLSETSKKLIARFILNCEFSIKAIQNPVAFEPINLGRGINTQHHEYLPSLTADDETLVFTRQIKNNEDFFKSSKRNNHWDNAVYLSENINTAEYNEGAQYISPDGMYLFFTGCNRPDGLGRCDIYISRREGKEWSEPSNLGPPVNTAGWESQPSLSADGRTLYFTSVRAGGLGGYDIWKSELKLDASWTVPVNLGPAINTPDDEQSAFIHPDGQTLYFSSDGWPGFGKKDLFFSRKDTSGKWQKPENLGYPINTFGEESGMTISNNGQAAFFTSDKAGGYGGLDIYSFELPANARPKPVTYVKGMVFDKKTKEPLDARIHIIDLKSGKIMYDEITDSETGEFLISLASGQDLDLNVDREGYLFYSENFSLNKPNSAAKPFNISIGLQKLEVGGAVILKNIFFGTNEYTLLEQSKTELQQLIDFLNLNTRASIEIQGHTDNVGDESANQILSENRAKAVYNYLINNKISPARLTVKGYGETRPIADNGTEDERQKNRRTEFIITGLK